MRRSDVLAIGCALALVVSTAPAVHATSVAVTNLVSDDKTVHDAVIQDSSLVNPWGVSFSGSSPFWVSDNGSGVATLYRVDPVTGVPTKLGLTVTIPGAGNVTGQAFNPNSSGGEFNGDIFLFVSEDGTVSGWRGALGTSAEVLATADPANVYKGATLGAVGVGAYLYAANFGTGAVDVFKGSPGDPALTGSFVDPTLPSGYAPFGIRNLGGTIYVTYAQQDTGNPGEELAGPGFGFVSAFDLNGNFLGRVASDGTLNAPWGLAIAPAGFDDLGGDLLVGNFGDGRINVFDPSTNTFLGQLTDVTGTPLAIDGLWALTFGNGGQAGNPNVLFFTAGPDDERHGLFGRIDPAPQPGTAALLVLGGLALGLGSWPVRRRPRLTP